MLIVVPSILVVFLVTQDSDPVIRARASVESGSVDAVDESIRAANSQGPQAAQVNQILDQAAAQQLPESGFCCSRLSVLVASSIRCKDMNRASRYLAGANWHPGTKDADKDAANVLAGILKLEADSRGKKFNGREMARLWNALSQAPISGDALAVETAKEQLILVGVAAAMLGNSEDLVGQCTSLASAQDFWHAVRDRLLQSGSVQVDKPVLALAKACETHLADKGCQCKCMIALSGMKCGEPIVVVRFDPMRKVRLLRGAFSIAHTEALRFESLTKLSASLCEMRDFKRALEEVQAGSAQISDATMRQELSDLVGRLESQKAADETRGAQEAKQLKIEQVEGRLKKSREWLEEMKKRNRPVEDIAACEEQIRLFEQELEALKQK